MSKKEVKESLEDGRVVSYEVAKKDIDSWMDFKKMKASKRKNNEEAIEGLIESISYGDLILNSDHTLTQKLSLPIENKEGEVTVTELIFAPRINMKMVNQRLKKVAYGDIDNKIIAYIRTLTGQQAPVIEALDTEDFSIARTISGFFL